MEARLAGSSGDKSVSQRLSLIGIVADIAAVLAVLTGPTLNLVLVVGLVALVLGVVQLTTSLGKVVDRWVLLAVVGIAAGATTVAVVVSRSLMDVPASAGDATAVAASTTESAIAPTPSTSVPATTTATSSSASAAEPTPSTSTTSGGIRRESGDEPVVLPTGQSIDLDSSQPDWGQSAFRPGNDLQYSGNNLSTLGAAPASAQVTVNDCMALTAYRIWVFADELDTGTVFCAKTNEGAYARLTIIARTDEQLTLDLVVWQKQESP